ncbi:uncharacterized protein Fot_50696 [Forsythia ovata]|uniref:Uncharacterized protein n=1 Tax=Forsythia ovata TaxID=205694 RepID=A0ABD1PZ09_9LAMI
MQKPNNDPHLISISLPQPKIRVKFPKLLMKSMHRRNHRGSNESNVDQKKASKNGDFLRKRIGFIILNACGSGKAQEMCSSCDQPKETGNAGDSNLKNSGPFVTQDVTFSKSHSCDEILEAKESAVLEEKVHGEKSGEDKKLVKMPTKISKFIRNRLGFPFRKWKLDEKINGGARQINCSKNLNEIRRVKPNYERIRSGKRVSEKVIKQDHGEEEERSEVELCKKRILMGEKCRPLNMSGALHYDTDGVLLPEEVRL